MAAKETNRGWWAPGFLIGLLGVFYLALGLASGRGTLEFGDGILFGGLMLALGGLLVWRRAPKSDRSGSAPP